MNNLFYKLTKFLTIKKLIFSGVYIMGIMILLFGLTMFYLSSTIKYDQNTMKHILSIEEQNKSILNDIKDINALDTSIIIASESSLLLKYEEQIQKNSIEHNFIMLSIDDVKTNEYNRLVKEIGKSLDKKSLLQNRLLENKNVILEYKSEIEFYFTKLTNYLTIISNKADSIYGLASLQSKRFNKAMAEQKYLDSRVSSVKFYSRVMSYAKELDSSVKKLTDNINKVLYSDNLELIRSVKLNEIDQNLMSINNLISRFLILEEKTYSKNIDEIKTYLPDFDSLINSLIVIKELQISQNIKFNEIINDRTALDEKIFSDIITLNGISKEIKLKILENSDYISKRSLIIIVTVGVLFLLIMSIAASILIYRINNPLSTIMDYMKGLSLKKESLSGKLPVTTKDEFGKLSVTFNSMIFKLSRSFQRIQSLNQEVKDTQKEVIFTMGAIGESRSKETGNHVKRVAEYSRLLAIYYGLPEKKAEILKQASPMHDIGKVAIPDSILKKPDILDEEQRKIMDTHATLGYEMLKHSKRELLQSAAIVAHEHHEKWDGSGYPRGLKGEEIHIYGRITALADVFDALGSDRCYKKAWEDEKIFDLFRKQSGKHFDPKLVEIFFEHVDEFLAIRDKLKDNF